MLTSMVWTAGIVNSAGVDGDEDGREDEDMETDENVGVENNDDHSESFGENEDKVEVMRLR